MHFLCWKKKLKKHLDVCLRLNRTFESVSVIFVWYNLNLTNQPPSNKRPSQDTNHQLKKKLQITLWFDYHHQMFPCFLYMFGSCREPQKTSRFPNIIKKHQICSKCICIAAASTFHLPCSKHCHQPQMIIHRCKIT